MCSCATLHYNNHYNNPDLISSLFLRIENNRLGGEVDRLDIINNDLDKTVASISEQKEQIEGKE